jgi:hypothetical protein
MVGISWRWVRSVTGPGTQGSEKKWRDRAGESAPPTSNSRLAAATAAVGRGGLIGVVNAAALQAVRPELLAIAEGEPRASPSGRSSGTSSPIRNPTASSCACSGVTSSVMVE